jgi:hypothetical protein
MVAYACSPKTKEDSEFEVSLGYTARPYLNKQQNEEAKQKAGGLQRVQLSGRACALQV